CGGDGGGGGGGGDELKNGKLFGNTAGAPQSRVPGIGTTSFGNPAGGTIGRPLPLPLVPSASGPALCAAQPLIPDPATTAAANTVAIKTLEEIFDTHRSYKPAAGKHRARSRTRRRDSSSEVKYINQNFSSGSSAPVTSEEEDNDEEEDELSKIPELNSPDSISDDLVQPLPLRQSPIKTTGPDTAKRNPSPYYYSDLLKNKQREQEGATDRELNPEDATRREEDTPVPVVATTPGERTSVRQGREVGVRYKKSSSLDTPGAEKEVCLPKRYSITEEGVRIIRCDSPSTTTSDDSDCSECRKRRAWHAQALAIARANCNLGPLVDASSMPPHRLLGPAAVCACATPAFGDDNDELFRPRSIFYVHQPGAEDCADCALSESAAPAATGTAVADEMANVRTRQIYETAFDSKITRSDDDLDEVDRITNQSVLLQLTKSNSSSASNMVSSQTSRTKRLETKRNKSASSKTPSGAVQVPPAGAGAPDADGSEEGGAKAADQLAQDLQEKLQIDKQMDNIANANSTSSSQLPLRGYTPSPPSTAPLPMKFPGTKHERFFINSIKSAPNLPSSNASVAQHPRLKDLRLDIQNVRNNDVPSGSCDGSGSMNDMPFGHGSKVGERPRSTLCLEPERVLELKRGHRTSHHHHGKQSVHPQRGRNFSSTESMATSSSGGSMESLKSSTSEGNRSTSSSDSRHSSSLSSHSSDSGPSMAFPLRVPVAVHNKLNILSPISDKSSQEPGSETSDINNKNNNSQKQSPVDATVMTGASVSTGGGTLTSGMKKDGEEPNGGGGGSAVGTEAVKTNATKRRSAPNKALLLITGPEMQGSDSGISLHSREDLKSRTNFLNVGIQRASLGLEKQGDHAKGQVGLPQDLSDLPFDMPKLRRRRAHLQQEPCTSGSVTSVDVGDLPFDMPKLRRRLRMSQTQQHQQQHHQQQQQQQQHQLQHPYPVTASTSGGMLLQTSTESSGLSQASSSLSMRDSDSKLGLAGGFFKQSLTLNLNDGGNRPPKKFGTLDLGLNLGTNRPNVDLIDASIPLDRQGWYHGSISRIDAEKILRPLSEGSFLVRNSESTRQDYSLTLKSAKGFMHMRIQRDAETGQFILGQFSRPFPTIPDMIRHFCLNRLPVRGAEHMCLLEPVIAQIL
uniref:SH2 domain-containing adapter protein D n=1 Tax=Anopheles farauti TaxID=69004 RepID=A0A182QMU4_9DIPT